MTVRGIEAIKMYMPPTNSKINTKVHVEIGEVTDECKPRNMPSITRYRQEWTKLLHDLDMRPDSIRESAFTGELKMSKFRSIYWALLLRVLNADYRSWRLQRKLQRNRYEKLKEEFVKNPHKDKIAADDNPLSQSQQSVWNQFFSDQELFGVIKQDVVRTFPGIDFFRKDVIQDAMTNILFYYAREHPYMSYRQGMHEILAPILFVVYSDHQSLLHYNELWNGRIESIEEPLLDVLDERYLEADTYSIFSRLMASIESYYRINNIVPTVGGYLPPNSSNSNVNTAVTEIEVIAHLNFIRNKILAKEDSHLHKRLLDLDIPLHLFGIRWLRLLFGREFILVDLLMMWDAIFADSDRFELPNYILVAMLIRIRDRLLMSDYTTCLTYLMRYPPNEDANLILRHALNMQMPSKYHHPPNAFTYIKENVILNENTTETKHSRNGSDINTKSETINLRNKQKLVKSVEMRERTRSRTTSLMDNVKIQHQISTLQIQNALDTAVGNDQIVNDGYLEKSPQLLHLELKNMQTVVMIARQKLREYLITVREYASKTPSSSELTQALDGIEELCHFLDVKCIFSQHVRPRVSIDQATEANEQKAIMSTRNNDFINETRNATDSISSDFNSLNLTSYEKPDVGFMFNSSQFLGNLKDIELLPILTDEKIALTTVTSSAMDKNSRNGQ